VQVNITYKADPSFFGGGLVSSVFGYSDNVMQGSSQAVVLRRRRRQSTARDGDLHRHGSRRAIPRPIVGGSFAAGERSPASRPQA
jgi:hypothetical protein